MNYSKLLGMIAAFDALTTPVFDQPVKYEPSPVREVKPKGKLFVIEGVEIYAINYKNALRKYNSKLIA